MPNINICYYVTGHGFGHAIRTCQILKAFAPDVHLTLMTRAPERIFREELHGRAFDYVPYESDCGCLQSDSVTVLPRETLTRYRELRDGSVANLDDQIGFLRARRIHAIVSDIPPFPLHLASTAGIPGIAIGNFTWHDIYAEYVETAADRELLDEMARWYASSTLALLTPLATATIHATFPVIEDVPLVARKGLNVRAQLVREFGLPESSRLALLYMGNWGFDIDWAEVGKLRGWTFLVDKDFAGRPDNVRVMDLARVKYADAAGSVDAVISKAGYGTCTECIANNIPLIYVGRTGFSEYEGLVAGMKPWGGGILIDDASFFGGRWADSLDQALAVRPDANAYRVDGAEVIARAIEALASA